MELGRSRCTEPISPAVHCLGAEISGGVVNIDIYAVVPGVDLAGVGCAEVGSTLEEAVLDVVHKLGDMVGDALDGHGDFFECVATADFAGALADC